MPSRNELKSIAAGTLDSFVSRYNDYDGYWALGLLYRSALERSERILSLHLLGAGEKPADPLQEAVAARYREMLLAVLSRRSLPIEWVASATLTVEFEYPGRYTPALAILEKPFRAELALTTDLGRRIRVQLVRSCWPHDPKRESRSGRA